MMPAVNGWHAVVAALLFLTPRISPAAEDLPGAAKELARKTVSFAGGRVTVGATYRNISSLPDSDLSHVRREFEAALTGGIATVNVDIRITLSESVSQYLLVEEARKGEDTQVWIAGWPRSSGEPVSGQGVTIDKKLVWEQDEPILDVAILDHSVLVLSPSKIALYKERQLQQAAPVAPGKAWPRDPRGRLRLNGGRLQVLLPGIECAGAVQPQLAIDCRPSEEPWVLESGSRAILLATYSRDRNYFDGHVILQNGSRKSVAPFYSAAAVEDQGGTFWLLAMLDGRTQIFDAAFEAVAAIPSWGSDIVGTSGVGTSGRCAGGSPILATSAGDVTEPDSAQAFSIVNRTPVALGAPASFNGPVTALWPSTASSALAVVHDLGRGKYAAYVLTLVCTP